MFLKRVKEWQAGKRVLAGYGGVELAEAGDVVATLLDRLHTGRGLAAWPALPPVAEWLSLYRDHNRLMKAMVDGLWPADPGEGRASDGVREALRWFRVLRGKGREEILAEVGRLDAGTGREAVAAGAAFWRKALAEQQDDLAGCIEGKGAEDLRVARLWPRPEVQFFLRVWMPCVVLYREYPTRLLARARRGKVGPLTDLLRLDKAVIHEPRIAAHVHRWASEGNLAAFGKVARAFLERPKALSRKKVKARMAGLASLVLGAVGEQLTGPEIRRVFDAVAYAFSRGRRLRDLDLPEGDEALAKSIQRERQAWHILPKPDKNQP